MLYALDSSAIIYLLNEFPKKVMDKLWQRFAAECYDGNIFSDKEAKKIVEASITDMEQYSWLDDHKNIFIPMDAAGSRVLGEMIDENLLDFYEKDDAMSIRGMPVSTPFVIAMAKVCEATMVYRRNMKYEEDIIQICEKFNVTCIEVENMLINLQGVNS